jgi:hypothetical protein
MTNKAAVSPAEHPNPFVALVALDDGSGNIACSFHDASGTVYESHQPSLIEKGAAAG